MARKTAGEKLRIRINQYSRNAGCRTRGHPGRFHAMLVRRRMKTLLHRLAGPVCLIKRDTPYILECKY